MKTSCTKTSNGYVASSRIPIDGMPYDMVITTLGNNTNKNRVESIAQCYKKINDVLYRVGRHDFSSVVFKSFSVATEQNVLACHNHVLSDLDSTIAKIRKHYENVIVVKSV